MKLLQHLATDSEWGRFVWNSDGGAETASEVSGAQLEYSELHEETQERLKALRVQNDEIDSVTKAMIGLTSQKLAIVESKLEDGLSKEEIKEIAGFSDPKEHFYGNGIPETIAGKEGEGAKLYRTEMTARICDLLAEKVKEDASGVSKEDAATLTEAMMREMKIVDMKSASGLSGEKELHAWTGVYQASRMLRWEFADQFSRSAIPNLKEVAKDMAQNGTETSVTDGNIDFDGKSDWGMTECEILTGGSMLKIDPSLLGACKFENVIQQGTETSETTGPVDVLDENGVVIGTKTTTTYSRFLIGQMKNGCQGNLVVLNVNRMEEEFIPVKPGGGCSNPEKLPQLECVDGTANVGYRDTEIVEAEFGVDIEGEDIATLDGKISLANQAAEISTEARENAQEYHQKLMNLVNIMQKRMNGGLVEGGAIGLLDVFKPKDRDLRKAGFEKEEIQKFNEHFDKAWVEGEKKVDAAIEQELETQKAAIDTNIAPEARKEIASDMTEKMAKTKEYLKKDLGFWAMGVAAAGVAVALAPGTAAAFTVGTVLAAAPLGNIKLPGYKLNELPGLNEMSETMLGVKYTDALDASANAESRSQAADENLAKGSAEYVLNREQGTLDDYFQKKNDALLVRSEQMEDALSGMETSMKMNFADLLGDKSEGGDKLNDLKMLRQVSTKFLENGKEFRQAIKALKDNPEDVMAQKNLENLEKIISQGFTQIQDHFSKRFGFAMEDAVFREFDENGEWKVPTELPFEIDGVKAIAVMENGHWTGDVKIGDTTLSRDGWRKDARGNEGYKKAYRKIRKACDRKQLDERLKLIQRISGVKHVIEVNRELHEDREEVKLIFENKTEDNEIAQSGAENVHEAAAWATLQGFGDFDSLMQSEAARYFLAGGEDLSESQKEQLLAEDFDAVKFVEQGGANAFPELVKIQNYYEARESADDPAERVAALHETLEGGTRESFEKYQEFTLEGMPRAVAYSILEAATNDPSILINSGYSAEEAAGLAEVVGEIDDFEEVFSKLWADVSFRETMHETVKNAGTGDILDGCEVPIDYKKFVHTDDTVMGKKNRRMPISYAMIKNIFDKVKDEITPHEKVWEIKAKMERPLDVEINDVINKLNTDPAALDVVQTGLKGVTFTEREVLLKQFQNWGFEISSLEELRALKPEQVVLANGEKFWKVVKSWVTVEKGVRDPSKVGQTVTQWFNASGQAVSDPTKRYRTE